MGWAKGVSANAKEEMLQTRNALKAWLKDERKVNAQP